MRGGKEVCNGSPLRRFAAISRLFGRAMLSLCLRFSGSVLALSVTFGDSSPRGRAIGMSGHFLLDARGPIGRKRAGLATEGRPVLVQPLRRCAPAPLVGEPLAKRRSFPLCQSLPYKGRWHGVSRDGEVVLRQSLSCVGKSGSWHRFLYLFGEVYDILVLRPCPPILLGRG